ncbi:hypothetical protein Zm00014a_026149 [Zea mays]|uniref:Uncharacterized protein n=1 Tax=Zea mays TaxID=4577 RepID=A0A3L6EPS4_MAIZE|nr:hypothetical protein Zm00014a_026149 [Zea mays]
MTPSRFNFEPLYICLSDR